MAYKYKYINNTNADIRGFHNVLLEAISNEGKFRDDLADVFTLTKNPEGSAAEYSLNFALDE